ncbi:MAG: Hpt domain-containing protein, partial [Candidatus Magnetoovum sp. WYHC-5]|nr:Hpt domain-containing protein [Candidatus Magnetoovum sp. WYHC-5]
AMKGDMERCIMVGMNDYVSKPIDSKKLIDVLDKWIAAFPKEYRCEVLREGMGGYIQEKEIALNELPKTDSFVLDIKAALDRLGGDIGLLNEFLERFYNNYSDKLAELKHQFEAGNFEATKILAHTLKGVAGNIAAMALYTSLAEFEKQLYNQQNNGDKCLTALIEKREVCLHTVEDDFIQLLNTIEGLGVGQVTNEHYSVNSNDEDNSIDILKLTPLIIQLYKLLQDDDYEAKEFFSSMKECLSNTKFYKETCFLENNINSFNYKEALVHLTNIAETLEVSLIE